MTDKELFYLLIKNSDVVINQYKELTKSPDLSNVSPTEECPIRKDFESAYNNLEEIINKKYRNDYVKRFPYSIGYYDFKWGKTGFDKYGIFAYIPLYQETLWTLDIIEKYKDSINLLLLLEFGDFEFSESLINKYYSYIPWITTITSYKEKVIGTIKRRNSIEYIYERIPFQKKVHKPFTYRKNIMAFEGDESGTTLGNFSNIGLLSSNFIMSHFSELDIRTLCRTGKFEMTKDLFFEIYENAEIFTEHTMGGEKWIGYKDLCSDIKDNLRISISTETIWYIASVLKAKDWELLLYRMEITADNLLKFYELEPQALEVYCKLDFEERKKIMSIIEKDDILYNKVYNSYFKKLYQGGNLIDRISSYYYNESIIEPCKLPFTYDFSIDLIKANIDNWNQRAYKFNSARRKELDTTYQIVEWRTIWQLLAQQETIFLTYDLCKYLINIDITVGGKDEIDYDTYEQYEIVPDSTRNALKVFQWCEVKDEDEYKKIIEDTELVDFFFSNTWRSRYDYNYHVNGVLKRLIIDFFKDFSFCKFEELVRHINCHDK